MLVGVYLILARPRSAYKQTCYVVVNLLRLLAGVRDLWNVWEIHCLILLSLFLQVLILLTAGMRRRSASSVLRTVLWLAYLSADSVAIFVLGHLAAHASGPRHQLMFFWAPFVLVHLGGQDTMHHRLLEAGQ